MRLPSSKHGKRGVQMPCLQLRTAQVMRPGLPCYFLRSGHLPKISQGSSTSDICSKLLSPPLLCCISFSSLPSSMGNCISDRTGCRGKGQA